jgi:hypothetical protein
MSATTTHSNNTTNTAVVPPAPPEAHQKAYVREVTIPGGFRRVAKDEFFATLYADARDIMPSIIDSPFYTTWETKSRFVWGWTAPGWKNPSAHEKIYALRSTS